MIPKKLYHILFIFLSALFAILSHPTVIAGYSFPNLGFLAWVAYIPLFVVIENRSPFKQFKLTFLFGIIFNAGAMYWLYTALNSFGHLSPLISVLVLFVLFLILSTYFSVIFLISTFIETRLKISRFWILPIVWVGIEWCRNHFPVGGFPWGQVGYSQARYPLIIQIADLVGVYGVTAFLVWVNLAGVAILKLLSSLRTQGSPLFQGDSRLRGNDSFFMKLVFIVLLFSFVLIYGTISQKNLLTKIKNFPSIRIGLIQGNIPQSEKWLSEKSSEIVNRYEELTQKTLLLQPDLLIWPESAYPFEISLDPTQFPRILGKFPKDFLFGSVTYEGILPEGLNYFPPGLPIHNSALLIQPGSNELQAYHKQHLVPYGEYIPLKEVLPFVKKLTAQMGEFKPGKEFTLLRSWIRLPESPPPRGGRVREGVTTDSQVTLPLTPSPQGRGEEIRIGSLICYEDVFPEVSRGHAKAGANLLVNLTNDAWYGNSSALPQHLNFSIFRAVENRRSLARATNTGITAIIDASGKIQNSLPVFKEDLLVDFVTLISTPLTVYSRFGDFFAVGCGGISLLMVLIGLMKRWL